MFKRLLKLLQRITPNAPLPDGLVPLLLQWLSDDIGYVQEATLEWQGEKPRYAYFVVKGCLKVNAWNEDGDMYMLRIYRPDTIAAFKEFLTQEASDYEIRVCRNSVVRRISIEGMREIYRLLPGMEKFAFDTALNYNQSKEKLHRDLLAIEQTDDRVLRFYKLFSMLYPAKGSRIRDADIASFLHISRDQLKKARTRLKREGLL